MIPERTDEQRRAALEKAMSARKARAALKVRIKVGEVFVADAMAHPDAQDMRVKQFIMAFPGFGCARAEAVMRAAKIAETRRVRSLGTRQRSRLVELLAQG